MEKNKNLKNITEEEWNKYKKMQRIGNSMSLKELLTDRNLIVFTVITIAFVLMIYSAFLTFLTPAYTLSNMANNIERVYLNNSGSFIFDEAITLNEYNYVNSSILFILFLCILYSYFTKFLQSNDIKTYKQLKRNLKYKENFENKLLKAEYTKKDIDWYFEVSDELFFLKYVW